MNTIRPATTARPQVICTLTELRYAMATAVATHGGSTFHTNMFSTVNTAFDVAVIRLVSMPGSRSAK